jgi:GTP-binding protein LepA
VQQTTRNFCIIAHIDHGKSTLADRLLEVTGTVAGRDMQAQVLDTMDLERERGITIKLQPVTMRWKKHTLNLIDTPGHVDFSYEVSRSLAACEGALLLVDATQGIEAQTLATVEMARDHGLTIIPVVNKIDLPAADPAGAAKQIEEVIGLPAADVIAASGKTGEGAETILQAIIDQVPPPSGQADASLRSLIFDSAYDSYRGVVAYIRVVDGTLKKGSRIRFMVSGKTGEASEIGVLVPGLTAKPELTAGDVGYVVTNLKNVAEARVGDTITALDDPATEALPGYAEARPMVFAGLYTSSGDQFAKLRDALNKLGLNDAALSFEPHSSPSLGLGFRCGFLGLLHLDIVRQRLEREYDLELVVTAPSVSYEVATTDGQTAVISNPVELPDPTKIKELREPWVAAEILSASAYLGPIIELIRNRRGSVTDMTYLNPTRVLIKAELPLASLVVDFYDVLKGISSGYASLSYRPTGYRSGELIKLDFLVAGDLVESLSIIVARQEAEERARAVLGKLKELIPRALFSIALQAAVGGKIIARETISPAGKTVTAGLYGGDVTRKRKVLEKQKKGKKRLKQFGSVEIPSEAYLAVLKS